MEKEGAGAGVVDLDKATVTLDPEKSSSGGLYVPGKERVAYIPPERKSRLGLDVLANAKRGGSQHDAGFKVPRERTTSIAASADEEDKSESSVVEESGHVEFNGTRRHAHRRYHELSNETSQAVCYGGVKVKKPRSQSSATAARLATKRPSENNRQVSDSKRAKKKVNGAAADGGIPAVEDDSKKFGDDSKKLFQRLWSEDDEIVILKGIIEYSAKNGADPVKDINAFHDFIKESLHGDFSKDQLYNKIRRLKSKYTAGKGKNGVDPIFSKPHDKKAFELAKKIWATEVSSGGGTAPAKSPVKVKKSQNEGGKILASSKPEDIDQNSVPSLSLSEMSRWERSIGLLGLNEDVVKAGLNMIGSSKKAELEKRWKELQIAELELYVKRSELIKDQAKLILEACKSSND